MLKHFRTALVWLMMLAIPTQGFAAATMLYCGPNHQRTAVGSEVASPANLTETVVTHHAVADAQSPHSGHGAHEHASSAAVNQQSQSAGVTAGVTDQVSVAGVPQQSSTAKCSVCALCCNAAAVVSSALIMPSPDISLAPTLSVYASPLSFLTGGPQRPPRSFLA